MPRHLFGKGHSLNDLVDLAKITTRTIAVILPSAIGFGCLLIMIRDKAESNIGYNSLSNINVSEKRGYAICRIYYHFSQLINRVESIVNDYYIFFTN